MKLEFDVMCAEIVDHATNHKRVWRPRKMRKKLMSLYDPTWDIEFKEALILLNCMGQMMPARTYGNLTQVGAALIARGDEARLDWLRGLITDYLHPVSLTPHGYTTPFKNLDSEEIYNRMGQTLAPLADVGLPFFLYAGALLGHVRNGKLIEHDDDIDVAVMLGECTPEEVGPMWREVKLELDLRNLLTEESRVTNRPVYKFKSDMDFEIDLFPAWTHESKFSVFPYAAGDMDDGDIVPLISFGQDPLMFPADSEAFLAHCYGPSWRVPDPLFHLNWKKRKQQFKMLFATDYALAPREEG